MSAFSEPPHARRRHAKPWPVVKVARALQDAHRAAQGLREDVLTFTAQPDYRKPVRRFNPFTKYLLTKVETHDRS